MCAVLIGEGKGPEKMYIGDAPKLILGLGDVLVQESTVSPLAFIGTPSPFNVQLRSKRLESIEWLISACHSSFDTQKDIHQKEGNYPAPPGISTIFGIEFSGLSALELLNVKDEVLELAGGVSRKTYAEVALCNDEMGAYAEYIVVPYYSEAGTFVMG